ncbi:MAG: DUF3108 domain-containing protein [Ramlibacter sp.]
MAGRAALIASTLLVLGGHALVLDWLAHQWREPPPMRLMAEPMFTRMIALAPPPAPRKATPRGAPAAAVLGTAMPVAASRPAAQTPTDALPEAPQAQAPSAPALPAITLAPPEPAPAPTAAPAAAPVATATAATAAPSADSPPVPAADPLAGWPVDTRLSYVLTGWYRGELQGDARVQWQRQADRYQVRVEIDINTFISLTMTSQGQVSQQGLRPSAYEETRRGRTRAMRMNDTDVVLEGGQRLPRPDGLQDTASQFVDLAYRFASQMQPLQTGGQVSFWMARPGAVDLWTYDVVEDVVLHTPKLGAVQAFHLKPRPIANPRGNITAEMWFAPGLQYLPVRIRINQGSDIHLDLLVEKIEQ